MSESLPRSSPRCMLRKWHNRMVIAQGMSPCQLKRLLVVEIALLCASIGGLSSFSVFVVARSLSRRICVPCTLEAAKFMLLIELSYSDSTMIFQASDPASTLEVELRVCGVHLARSTLESAVLEANIWKILTFNTLRLSALVSLIIFLNSFFNTAVLVLPEP